METTASAELEIRRKQPIVTTVTSSGKLYHSIITADDRHSGQLLEVDSMTTVSLPVQKTPEWKKMVLKIIAILMLLYLFVCSLGFMSDSFRLIAGKAAGQVLQQEILISNPIVGVMMGVLVTVAVQSSSTSTSIIVSMVASGPIPIIMGANIGTSVTNTVVALTHMSNKDDFERAFGGAVLHDMFNILTVTVLLIVEQLTSYLEVTTTRIMQNVDLESKQGGEIQVLSVLTKPFTSLIVQIDKNVIVGWSINDPKYDNARLIKVWCNNTSSNSTEEDGGNGSPKKCKFLFNMFEVGDLTIGVILLASSLVMLCGCLVCLVRVLASLLQGKLAATVQKGVNADIPFFPCLTGYLAMAIGMTMTILVQSSSVFTSSLTPLIAMGVISLERAYPLTLGSNLGTTTTAMLAALAAEGPNLKWSIQLALCHFLFNLTGILIFYPIPFMRFPIRMAGTLGRVTAKYRWFAIFYLVFMFLILPLLVFTLSLIGAIAFYCVSIPVGIVSILAIVLNMFQSWCIDILPVKYRNFNFLPIWCHSLEPYDRIVQIMIAFFRSTCCACCCKESNSADKENIIRSHSSSGGLDNLGFTRSDPSTVEQEQTQL